VAKEKKEKLSRKEKKELKSKAKAQGLADVETEETVGSKIGVVVVTLFIIAVWLGIFSVLIKWDVGGFGSTVLYPVFKDVPVISAILPNVKTQDAAADGDYPYDTLAQAVEQIKSLELQLQTAQDQITKDNDTVAQLNAEIERLKVFEQQQNEYQQLKAKFDEEIVFNNNAPDVSQYKAYYESISPDNAELLYKQVVQQTQASQEVKDYAKTYSSMKPAQAAGIFDTMTNNLDLVAQILDNMSAAQSGSILGAMDPTIAAKVTKIMAPKE
jgi:flagellar motility protein MotE (MotC chaperone)